MKRNFEEEADRIIDALDETLNYAKSTRLGYRRVLKDFCAFMGGIENALSASVDDADRWLQDLVDRGLPPATCQSSDLSLSAIFTNLYALEMIPHNPLAVKRRPKPYPEPELYHNPVSVPEMRALLERFEIMFLGAASSKRDAMKGLIGYLHVKHCIPHDVLLHLRVSDYAPGDMFGAITWVDGQKKRPFTVSLDKQATQGMNRHLQSLGKVPGDSPLFPKLEGRQKGGFYATNYFSNVFGKMISDAGIELNGRSLKAGAVEMAFEAGLSAAEVRACLPTVSMKMIEAAVVRQGMRSEGELLDILDAESRSRVPAAQGVVETAVLERALENAGGRTEIEFIVTATGKLLFPEIGIESGDL